MIWITDIKPTKEDGNMHGEVIVSISGFDRSFACQWNSSYIHGSSFIGWMPFPEAPTQDKEAIRHEDW